MPAPRIIPAALAALLLTAAASRADLPRAQKFLAEAKGEIERQSHDGALKKLELAEAELDGVPADDQKPVRAAIAQARADVAAAKAVGDKTMYARQLKRVMDEAEGAVGNLVTWAGAKGRAEEFFKKPEARAALGTDLDEAQKQFATFAALHAKKAAVEYRVYATDAVAALEKTWADSQGTIANSQSAFERDRATQKMQSALKSAKEKLALLAADDDTRKALAVRAAAVETAFGGVGNAGEAAEVLARLKDSWDLDTRDCGGWEAEKADVTFEQYGKESSEKMSAFGAPKTVKFLQAAKPWLGYRENDKAYQAVKDAPAVKAFVDANAAAYKTASDKIEAAAAALVAAAEKTPITDGNRNGFDRLASDVRVSLNDAAKSAPYVKRIESHIEARTKAAVGESQARDEWYAKAKAQAAAKWPEMKAKFAAGTGFDPTKPKAGQLYAIDTDNLMGYRFKPGDFPFATTINGHAVAAKYDPTVAGAVAETQKRLGRDLGDSDDDGRWEIVVRVEGGSAKLMARRQTEGDLTLNGTKVGTYRGEYSEPVDAVVVTIVAAKCGPMAAAAGVGMVTETGETKAVTSNDPALTGGSSGFTGYGTVGSILRLLVGLGVAFAALVLAGFTPLIGLSLKADKLAVPFGVVGALAAGAGLAWLVASSFHGFGAAFVLAATGLFVVGMALAKLGVLKPDLAAKVRPFGVPLAFACAGVVLVSVIAQGRLWVV